MAGGLTGHGVDSVAERRGWSEDSGLPTRRRGSNRKDDSKHRPALELVQSIKAKEQRILELLDELDGMLQ